MDEERGRVGRDELCRGMGCQREEREQMDRLEQFIGTKQMYRQIYSKKGDGQQYQLGK